MTHLTLNDANSNPVVTAAILALVAAASSGCSEDPPQVCTLIDCVSSSTIRVVDSNSNAITDDFSGELTFGITTYPFECLENSDAGTSGGGVPSDTITCSNGTLSLAFGTKESNVAANIKTANNALSFTGSVDLETSTFQPNGSGCGRGCTISKGTIILQPDS